jgi:transposase
MRKHTEQFKLQVVEEYREGQTLAGVARRHSLDRGLLREWVAAYEKHGAKGLAPRAGHYTAEFKVLVLRHMQDHGLSLRQTAAHFNLGGWEAISQWQRRYDAEGVAAFAPSRSRGNATMQQPSNHKPKPVKDEDRTREDLIDELEDLRAEVAFLKKYNALVQAKEATAPQKKRK